MISIDCHHPDIEEFITIKSNLDKVTKANISIRITHDFMEAVKNNEDFKLEFTREESDETITKIVKAKDIFHKLCEMNWDYAEPGMLFWDRISNWNLLSNTKEFKYAGTNPCAEEPLPAGGSCLLGSINLSEFVKNPFTKNAKFDWSDFAYTVEQSIIALNEVLEEGLPLHPLKEQRESVNKWKQIGLGIMGLADMLMKLGITYGSIESIKLCDSIGQLMTNTAIEQSAKLAQKYGAFPACNVNEIMETEFFTHNTSPDVSNLVKKYGLRNSQLLTIAPTGTLSTMLGISGGIEPMFAKSYKRKTESLHGKDVYYDVYSPICQKYIDKFNTKVLPNYFIESHEIPYEQRIKIQSTWQQHIDASISSTINLSNEVTIEDVKNIYMDAWMSGLKGVTIYRDGCKRSGILTTSDTKKENDELTCTEDCLERGVILSSSDDLLSCKRTIKTGCGKFYLHADFDEYTGQIYETYIDIGSKGGCERNYNFISRLISLCLRGGIPIESIIDQAKSIRPCKAFTDRTKDYHDTSKGTSCPSAIGNALEDLNNKIKDRFILDDNDNENSIDNDDTYEIASKDNQSISEKCPECGEPLIFEGGCNVCKNCGWSHCSI